MPRRSGAISNRSRHTRAACSTRCRVPDVDHILGLPPAVALQQQRGSPTTRSSVGSVSALSNSLRMLYSRAGNYPAGQELLYAESFSPNTPEGACPTCHGLIRHADWIVDVGPAAGEQGGHVLYSGPPAGLNHVEDSQTRRFLFAKDRPALRESRLPADWLRLEGVTRNNLHQLDVAFPLGVLTSVAGVSGSGKSSLVSQVLVELVAAALGHALEAEPEEGEELDRIDLQPDPGAVCAG